MSKRGSSPSGWLKQPWLKAEKLRVDRIDAERGFHREEAQLLQRARVGEDWMRVRGDYLKMLDRYGETFRDISVRANRLNFEVSCALHSRAVQVAGELGRDVREWVGELADEDMRNEFLHVAPGTPRRGQSQATSGELVKARSLALKIGVHFKTLSRWADQGFIHRYKPSARVVLFDEREVEEYLRNTRG